ncbi:MAG: tRNA (adenosine(37)-N6)-threonylcarbamoyltransferase complex ATPase subunit type 1 TsaE [Synergistaceae bacterium]|nr:tRNA (adenosine(37)-N6)-threonylcarbamoyltransferase complex ATPase subunit type 1 TsaE [Synergistaceae bacterium]
MTERIFFSRSEDDTRELGRRIGENLCEGLCVLLYGDLGAGKTVLVRGVGEALGISGVRSPSFTLINEYESGSGLLVIHADLYRLGENDAGSLGLEEYEDSALFVEWPERWRNPPVEDVMRVYFSAVSESEREVRILAVGERAEGVLMKL